MKLNEFDTLTEYAQEKLIFIAIILTDIWISFLSRCFSFYYSYIVIRKHLTIS